MRTLYTRQLVSKCLLAWVINSCSWQLLQLTLGKMWTPLELRRDCLWAKPGPDVSLSLLPSGLVLCKDRFHCLLVILKSLLMVALSQQLICDRRLQDRELCLWGRDWTGCVWLRFCVLCSSASSVPAQHSSQTAGPEPMACYTLLSIHHQNTFSLSLTQTHIHRTY